MATPPEDDATLQAARWLLLLEDEPDDAELRARFRAWLGESTANAEAWVNTADVYDLMARAPVPQPAPVIPLPIPLRPRPTRRWLVAGGGAAVAAGVGGMLAPRALLRLRADHATGTGELRRLQLADGSIVHLAPSSAIGVRFSGQERHVGLLAGEALFEVARDPGRPFRVAAEGIESTALGTAFTVSRGEEGAAISVKEGKVRVECRTVFPAVVEELGAGDWLQLGWGGGVSRGAMRREDVAAWVQGQLVVRDQTVAHVVEQLRRYFRGAIMLPDAELARRKVSGVYSLTDPVAALRAVVAPHGGSIRRYSPWLLVLSGG